MRVLSERYACIDVVLQSTAIVVRRLVFLFFCGSSVVPSSDFATYRDK